MGQDQASKGEGVNPFELLGNILQTENNDLKLLLEENKIEEALNYFNLKYQENIQQNQQRNGTLDFDSDLIKKLAKKGNQLFEYNGEYINLAEKGKKLLDTVDANNWKNINTFFEKSEIKMAHYNSYKVFIAEPGMKSDVIINLETYREELKIKLIEDLKKNVFVYFEENPNYLSEYPLNLSEITFDSFEENKILDFCRKPVATLKAFNDAFSNSLFYSDKDKINNCIFSKNIASVDNFKDYYLKINSYLEEGSLSEIPRELLTIIKIPPKNSQDFDYNFSDTYKFYTTQGSIDKLDQIESKFKIVIIPKKANYQSKTLEKGSKSSRFHVRTDSFPNPAYANAQNELYNAQQDSTRNAISDTMPKNYGYGTAGAFAALLDIALDIGVSSNLGSAKNNLNNTAQYIQKPVYQDYEFRTSRVNTNKIFEADIYFISDKNKIMYIPFKNSSDENFDLAFDVHPKDNSSGYFKTQEDIAQYQKEPLSIDLENIFNGIADDSVKLSKVENISVMKKQILAIQTKPKALDLPKNITRANADKRFNNVVVVLAPDGSTGTGFYVAPNLVITNHHVIENSKFLEIKKYDGSMTFGKVQKVDIDKDLALLKVESNGDPVSFFNKDSLPLGSTVQIIGHPSGLEFSITSGVVSAFRKIDLAKSGVKVSLIQTDASINQGNSGGPLFLNDQVIGVNVMKLSGGSTEGLGFAIHYSEVIDFLYK